MDAQMPETFLSTNKLENQLLLQRQKLQQLQGQNRWVWHLAPDWDRGWGWSADKIVLGRLNR